MDKRASFLPTMKFAQDHGLELAGFGVVTSTWNIYTPRIFEDLGLHEPVYGSVAEHSRFALAKKIDNAKQIAETVDETQLDPKLLKHLNQGSRLPMEHVRLPTKLSLALSKRLETHPVPELPTRQRVPKLTLVGAAGWVKAKESLSNTPSTPSKWTVHSQ